jgi:hypothetical protein
VGISDALTPLFISVVLILFLELVTLVVTLFILVFKFKLAFLSSLKQRSNLLYCPKPYFFKFFNKSHSFVFLRKQNYKKMLTNRKNQEKQ